MEPPQQDEQFERKPQPQDQNSQEGPNQPQTRAIKLSKSNILEEIKDFDSSIPDAVVHHFLNHAGMQTSDQRVVRLIAIAAQKFIHDIVSDSLQHCKLRGAQNKKTKEKKFTLAIEDLAAALEEYGIEVKRQLYFN